MSRIISRLLSFLLMFLYANFYIDAENILNEKYLVKEGYPVPGLLVKGGVILKI